jgi:spore coat polysaccharide biosynthesis protein SpsF (cytidylyltransferase family)
MINHSPVTSKYFHPEWSVTLDTREDYDVIRDIISVLGDNYDRRAIDIEVLMILMNTPEILDKNKSISRNIPGV